MLRFQQWFKNLIGAENVKKYDEDVMTTLRLLMHERVMYYMYAAFVFRYKYIYALSYLSLMNIIESGWRKLR